MLVLQYDLVTSDLDLNNINEVTEALTKKFPQETIVALPCGMTLMEMDWEEFDYWEKWLHVATEKLREDLSGGTAK